MEGADVYSRITEILRNVFDDDTLVATPELTAKQVEGWDSLAHIRLVLSVEKTFKVKFSASEIQRMQNIGELVSLIQSKA